MYKAKKYIEKDKPPPIAVYLKTRPFENYAEISKQGIL